MNCRISRTLTDFTDIQGNQLVINGPEGNPVLVAVELPSGEILVSHQGDSDFVEWLNILGIAYRAN